MLRNFCIVLTSLAMACGNGDDGGNGVNYDGIYQATHHTLNETSCASEGDSILETEGPAYLKLQKMTILDPPSLSVRECTGTTEDTCSSVGASFRQEDGEWMQDSGGGAGGTHCNLRYTRTVLTGDGTSVTIESRTYSEEAPSVAADDCNFETAKERGTSMPCVELEVTRATRVE